MVSVATVVLCLGFNGDSGFGFGIQRCQRWVLFWVFVWSSWSCSLHKIRITYSIKNLNPLSPCKTVASSKRPSLNPEVFDDGGVGGAMAEAMRVAEESVVGLRWRELGLVAASFLSPQTFSLIAQTSFSSCPAKASRWWRVGP